MKWKICLPILMLFVGCKSKPSKPLDPYDEKLYMETKEPGTFPDVKTFSYNNDTHYLMVKNYWDDGSIKGISFMINGKRNGPFKMFYPDGKIRAILYFKDGVHNGTEYSYDPNGQIRREEHYGIGKEVGAWLSFDSLGREIERVPH